MKKSALFAMLLFTIFAFASCNKKLQEDVGPLSNNTISIVEHVNDFTKATNISFEIGDEIGVTIKKTNGAAHLDNHKYYYTENGFATSEEQKWYEGEETSTVMAYYPYAVEYNGIHEIIGSNPDGVYGSSEVYSDQSNVAKYTASDRMIAIAYNVAPTAEPIPLRFTHQLTRVIINVNNKTGKTIDAVSFAGVKREYNWDLETVTPTGSVSSIKCAEFTNAADGYTNSYTSIFPPQTATPTLAIVIGEKQYNYVANQVSTFTGGKERAVNVVIDETGIYVAFDDTVNDWNPDEDMIFDFVGALNK